MKIAHSEREYTGTRSVLALGMFDGVHIGHQKLIKTAVDLARAMGADSVVCTFDRHPKSVVDPDHAPEPLLTLSENLEKMERLGADWALVKPFTPAFAALDPEDFLREICQNMDVAAIVAGENYSFGAKGRGNARMLESMQSVLHYRAVIVPPVMVDGQVVSSTVIRHLRRSGHWAEAEQWLAIDEKRL